MARTTCGKDAPDNPYDPQIGVAASQNAETAAKAAAFAEDYYKNTIAPLLQKTVASATETEGKLGKLYDENYAQMKKSAERYEQYGLPAEQKYYETVKEYSAPEEMERQAQYAKGDLGVAQANQQQQMMRTMSGLGVDPTSPAALSAMSDMAVRNAAAEAAAMNRARNAARTLGLQLTSDAANFGRGGQSGILQFGAGAQGNATSAFGVNQGALNSAAGATQSVNAGYNTALQGYGNNLSAYTSLGNNSMQIQAQQQAGFMGGLGSLVGTGVGLYAGKKW